MKKKNLVALLIVVSLVSVFVGSAATSLIKEIKAELRTDFTISVDGEVKEFKNANGDVVYPILYNGTTYLPVRAIGELMGKKVYWYENEKLIELKEEKTTVTDADVIVTSKEPASATIIDSEKAKEIALKDAGVKTSDVKFVRAELDKNDGMPHYEIEFVADGFEYDYDIKASDGTIIGKNKEKEVNKKTEAPASSNTGEITKDEAKKIALDKAGLSESDVTFVKAELDKDGGILKYEIEFKKGNKEYEADINAKTGEILKFEVDVD